MNDESGNHANGLDFKSAHDTVRDEGHFTSGQPSNDGLSPDNTLPYKNTLIDPNTVLNITQFRGLMGIPLGDTSTSTKNDPLTQPMYIAPATMNRPHLLPGWIHRLLSNKDPEAPTSIYYTILQQEKANWRRFYLYDWLAYGALVAQIVLAAALIVLGARESAHHISIAVIGAVQGVLAGILSLLKGQGLPTRLLRYAEAMRKAREEIDFHERELRMGLKIVTLGDVLKIRELYEQTRRDEVQNYPDIWQPGVSSVSFSKPQQNNSTVASSVAAPSATMGATVRSSAPAGGLHSLATGQSTVHSAV